MSERRDKRNLGAVIRIWRAAKGYSVRDTEKITGIDRSTWSRLENGDSTPSGDTLMKLMFWLLLPEGEETIRKQ